MKVYSDSVGSLPFWFFQGTFAACFVLLGLLLLITNLHGPSFQVIGISKAEEVGQHVNSSDYATALSRRFVHEYLNWSYQTHYKAKRQAAFLCSPRMQSYLMYGAKQKDHYYRQLRMVSNAKILEASVEWEDPKQGQYQVLITCQVSEWQGFVESRYLMECHAQLGPSTGVSASTFALEITGYDFKQISTTEIVESEATKADTTIEEEAIQRTLAKLEPSEGELETPQDSNTEQPQTESDPVSTETP